MSPKPAKMRPATPPKIITSSPKKLRKLVVAGPEIFNDTRVAPRSRLLSLPSEIRQMIYSMLDLVSPFPILVCRPPFEMKKTSRKRKWVRPPTGLKTTSYLLVNKQLYRELTHIICSRNRFVVGNGIYASFAEPNLLGLQRFTQYVSSFAIESITTLTINVYMREKAYYTRNQGYLALGNESDIAAFHSVCRYISKLSGLRNLQMHFTKGNDNRAIIGVYARFRPDYTVDDSAEIAVALTRIFKNCTNIRSFGTELSAPGVTEEYSKRFVDLPRLASKVEELFARARISVQNTMLEDTLARWQITGR